MLGLPYPNTDLPILFLHTKGREILTRTRSWTNDLHNETAIRLRRFIMAKIPNADVTILFYYSAAVKSIEQQDPTAAVYSINCYQGGECDFCIIVTTCVASNSESKNFNFVLDPQRTKVALSRAKEGVVIIGDRDVLFQSEVWGSFINKYSEASGKSSLFYG
ncbi:unnamed protein product [Enterobius vermicularis]|uniref:AAA_12 domain-containing protein n=1 Tax=Enterobius vermicularis TaxID=51028 RepID=A0A0N4V419_ENTVE|nr:unnamed protein product [Enterobius vermicularis]